MLNQTGTHAGGTTEGVCKQAGLPVLNQIVQQASKQNEKLHSWAEHAIALGNAAAERARKRHPWGPQNSKNELGWAGSMDASMLFRDMTSLGASTPDGCTQCNGMAPYTGPH